MDEHNRETAIVKTGYIGIGTNLFLVIIKMLVGLAAHSVAIVLDAVNNLTDMITSVLTIIGIKISKKAPDAKHPFGHGRVEHLSALFIGLFIFGTGFISLFDVIKRIIKGDVDVQYTYVTLIIVVISMLIKFIWGQYCKNKGKEYNSDALLGAGVDSLNDSLISASLLIGIVVHKIFHYSIDNILGIIISLFIMKAGIDMLMDILGDIVGVRPESNVTKSMKEDINSFPDVMGVYDLIIHEYGPSFAIGSVHIEIPSEMSVEKLHVLTDKIQRFIYDKYHVFFTIGIYSVNTTNEEKIKMRNKIIEIVHSFPGVINTHGVFIHFDEKIITFDILLDFTVKDKDRLRDKIVEALNKVYPEYKIEIKFDTDYSD